MTPEEVKANISSQEKHAANMGEQDIGAWLAYCELSKLRDEFRAFRTINGDSEDCPAVRILDALEERIDRVRKTLKDRRDEARDLAQRLRAELAEAQGHPQ